MSRYEIDPEAAAYINETMARVAEESALRSFKRVSSSLNGLWGSAAAENPAWTAQQAAEDEGWAR